MYIHVHTIIQKEQTQSFLQEKAYLCGILNRIFADVFNQFLGLFWHAKNLRRWWVVFFLVCFFLHLFSLGTEKDREYLKCENVYNSCFQCSMK